MKKQLYERFQELAGIKPLYEVGNLNLITEQTSSGNDPDCFACINDTVEILPLSQMSSTGGGITMCGWSNQGSTGQWGGYYVDLAALNNNLTNAGSGSCGSGGGNPPSTGSCDVNQAAQDSVVYFVNGAHPQLGDVGINQNFVNNMVGKSANFYLNRRQAFRSKRESLEISGQGFCQGENPNWQARLFNQRRWIKNKLQAEAAAGSCPGW